jgi:hypothetical protein
MTTLVSSHTLTYAERLERVETDFYQAVNDGEEALERFAGSFQQLLEDIQTVGPRLDDETIILASHVATRIRLLSEGFHHLQVEMDDLTEDAMKECEAIALECSTSHPQYVLWVCIATYINVIITGLRTRETNNSRHAIVG